MLIGTMFLIAVLPSAKDGMLALSVIIFFELFASFALQLVTAIVTESVGSTIAVMVAGNVFLNLFLMKLFSIPEIQESIKADAYYWTPIESQIIAIEIAVIVICVVVALAIQSRKRCFI